MRPRIFFALFFLRLGRFIQSLSLMVMKPNDLIEFSKRSYSKTSCIDNWSNDELINAGLNNSEKDILKRISSQKGTLLLIGIGGGREAIPLSEAGFKVTGVDFIPELTLRAIKTTRKRGITISTSIQEISKLDLLPEQYDVVWISQGMYSSVPTKKKRLSMLKVLNHALKPDGYLVCQFLFDSEMKFSPLKESIKKIFACLSLGNTGYEKGDQLWGNIEFSHIFYSRENLISELKKGGFKIIHINITQKRASAILCKQNNPN